MSEVARGHHSAAEEVYGWAAEIATYPAAFDASSYGDGSGYTYAYFPLADSPNLADESGLTPGYAIGNRAALFDKLGARFSEITIPSRISSGAQLARCVLVSNDLPSTAIYAGFNNEKGDGHADVYRWCKCANFNLRMGENSEIMFTPTFRSLGWPEPVDTGDLYSPDYAALTNAAAPLQWVNRTTIKLNNVEYAGEITALDINVDYGLINDNVRKDLGDDVPISRGIYLMKPNNVTINGSITMNTPLDLTELNSTNKALRWSENSDNGIVATFNDAAVGGAQGITMTLKYVRPGRITKNGGAATGQVTYTIPFTARIFSYA